MALCSILLQVLAVISSIALKTLCISSQHYVAMNSNMHYCAALCSSIVQPLYGYGTMHQFVAVFSSMKQMQRCIEICMSYSRIKRSISPLQPCAANFTGQCVYVAIGNSM